MSVRNQIGFAVLLSVTLVSGWLWFSGRVDPAEPDRPQDAESVATLVLVEPLTLAQDRVVLRAVGTGEALRSAALHPNVAGEVVEVLFEAEQRVEEDAPLLRLESEHERLAVRLAEVAQAEARRQVERLEQLAPKGHVATASVQTAQAELESASLRLAQANAALEDRTLYAPFEGIIGLPEVDPGDRVTDETLIATLDDRTSIKIRFTVPEDYARRVIVGDVIQVRPWSSPDVELQGTVSATDSRIDRVTRSLRVEALIPNPEERIRPGTSFDLRLEFKGADYPSVPEIAVLWSRDGAYLWRISGGRAEKVFVRVIRRDRGRVLVDGPLQAGDLIVVEGVQGLRNGQAVEPRPFQSDQLSGRPTPAFGVPA